MAAMDISRAEVSLLLEAIDDAWGCDIDDASEWDDVHSLRAKLLDSLDRVTNLC